MTGSERKVEEYVMPKKCEACGSENIVIRVIYDKEITRYKCLDCRYSRSVAKESNLKKRTNSQINHWAEQVKKHHPYCVICGAKDNLEAHHIIPVSHSRRFRFLSTNGITLCHECHHLVHNKDEEAAQ